MNEIEKFFDKIKKEQPEPVFNAIKNAWDLQTCTKELNGCSKFTQKIAVRFYALGYTMAKIEQNKRGD